MVIVKSRLSIVATGHLGLDDVSQRNRGALNALECLVGLLDGTIQIKLALLHLTYQDEIRNKIFKRKRI